MALNAHRYVESEVWPTIESGSMNASVSGVHARQSRVASWMEASSQLALLGIMARLPFALDGRHCRLFRVPPTGWDPFSVRIPPVPLDWSIACMTEQNVGSHLPPAVAICRIFGHPSSATSTLALPRTSIAGVDPEPSAVSEIGYCVRACGFP